MPSLFKIQDFVADIVVGFNNIFEYFIRPGVGTQMISYADSLPADNIAGKGFLATAGYFIQFAFGDSSLFEMMLLGGFGFIIMWSLVKWVVPLLK